MESSAATAAPASGTDFSLRSSGTTYLDQKGETDRIVDRIETSSASVIGIAGVRGAGKSSLAKKVLDKCDASGFFTLFIPSPTGYEPREFLLAIFQRIAEHASERIQTATQGAETLASLGRQQLMKMRWRLISALAGLLLVCLGIIAATYVQMTFWTLEKAAAWDVETRRHDIERAISVIQDDEHSLRLAGGYLGKFRPAEDIWDDLPTFDRSLSVLGQLNDDELNRAQAALQANDA